nr:nucleotidyl transferase AbiEii/AbiGii toxin family protein [Micromonospora globispora]
MQAHGILDRPSEDVDLFTAWERRGEFAAAVDAVVDGYRAGGYSVEVTQRFDTFARLAVTDPAHAVGCQNIVTAVDLGRGRARLDVEHHRSHVAAPAVPRVVPDHRLASTPDS